jgi:Circadian oscillating protein COP23
MTTKLHRLIPQIMAAVFTLFGIAACSTTTTSAPDTSTEANEPPTVFKCVQQGSGWATTVEKGNLTTKSPLITWDTKEFGDNYTPDKRCQIVSDKLTKAVAKNGKKLGTLQLIVGTLNNQNVVCVVNDGKKSCNDDNTLFTLNQNNSKNGQEVLDQILGFSSANANSPAVREKTSGSILLDNLVEEKLGKNVNGSPKL